MAVAFSTQNAHTLRRPKCLRFRSPCGPRGRSGRCGRSPDGANRAGAGCGAAAGRVAAGDVGPAGGCVASGDVAPAGGCVASGATAAAGAAASSAGTLAGGGDSACGGVSVGSFSSSIKRPSPHTQASAGVSSGTCSPVSSESGAPWARSRNSTVWAITSVRYFRCPSGPSQERVCSLPSI